MKNNWSLFFMGFVLALIIGLYFMTFENFTYFQGMVLGLLVWILFNSALNVLGVT